jgi:hypothetical protein
LGQAISSLATGAFYKIEMFLAYAISAKYFDQASDGLPENGYALNNCLAFLHEAAQFALCQTDHLSSSSDVRRLAI